MAMQQSFLESTTRHFLELTPEYLLIKNAQLEYVAASHKTAVLFGFEDIEELVGKTDYEINCPAVRQAELWRSQDRIVLESKQPLITINLETYVSDTSKLLAIKKYPIFTTRGMLIYCNTIELSTSSLNSTILINESKENNLFMSPKKRDLILVERFPYHDFTIRESECLFYLCRGYTAKETSALLNISVRTVEFHLNNIKDKTGYRNQSSLISYTIQTDMISMIPISLIKNHNIDK